MRIAEIFRSIQGEGLHVGVPSVFLRVVGCNLTCPGFGLPYGERAEKVTEVPITEFMELSVPKAGCDSQPAWNSAYKRLWTDYTPEELAKTLNGLAKPGDHLVITGGEPLLKGSQKHLAEVLPYLDYTKFTGITFETNGTQTVADYLIPLVRVPVTFSVSPKLSNSGEPWKRAIVPDAIESMARFHLVLKYVIREERQLAEVILSLAEYDIDPTRTPVYLMPEGAVSDQLGQTACEVAQLALDNGFRYSPRLHVDLFGNTFGT